jgi:Fe-S cluster biosynthesis and repair protein YggX
MSNNFETTWNKKEFKAYTLLYCSQVDLEESNAERGLIVQKVGKENYNHIYQEIEQDNDYTRVQKILAASKRLDYNTEKLLKDMREVFFSDNEFDEVEKGVFLLLKKLLN